MEHIKEFFSQLFTSLDSTDSIVSLLLLAVSFLIGIFTGWLSRGGKIRRLKRELAERDGRIKNLDVQLKAAQDKYNAKETELENTIAELEEIQETNRRLINEKQQLGNEKLRLNNQLRESTTQINKLRLSNQEFISTNENHVKAGQQYSEANKEYAKQIEELKAEIDRQKDAYAELKETNAELRGENRELNEKAINFDSTIKKENAISQENTQRILAVEARLNQLQNENSNLKSEVNSLRGSSTVIPAVPSTSNTTSTPVRTVPVGHLERHDKVSSPAIESTFESMETESPEARSAKARAVIKAALGSKIKQANPSEKDDLKLINGIGPFIEEKLNAIGLYTYEQVSQLDEELVERVTDAIQFFPGRIKRDDWVGQAAKLFRTRLG